MKYEITIKKIEEVISNKEGSYGVISTRPWTQKEIDEAKYSSETRDAFLKHSPVKEIRGYEPDRDSSEEVETEVLKQTVTELDIPKVIKAINGI